MGADLMMVMALVVLSCVLAGALGFLMGGTRILD